jgi:hypothetical protein
VRHTDELVTKKMLNLYLYDHTGVLDYSTQDYSVVIEQEIKKYFEKEDKESD